MKQLAIHPPENTGRFKDPYSSNRVNEMVHARITALANAMLETLHAAEVIGPTLLPRPDKFPAGNASLPAFPFILNTIEF
jgi:hypothetical protein